MKKRCGSCLNLKNPIPNPGGIPNLRYCGIGYPISMDEINFGHALDSPLNVPVEELDYAKLACKHFDIRTVI